MHEEDPEADDPEPLNQRAVDELLARVTPPTFPLTRDWGLSIADLVAVRWAVPSRVRRLLRLLNRFGAVRLSPEGVGVDGTDVAWDALIEIRRVSLFEIAHGDAIEASVDQLAVFLPPLPGRRWLLRRVARLVAALALRFASAEEADWPSVPVVLVHRTRLGRAKETSGGLIAALLWAAVPEATRVLEQVADERGVPVVGPR